MKLVDYIVDFCVERGISEFFGYQGTYISHFVDAIARNPLCSNHSCYNEQGAAFAACGLAQSRRKCAVAYATSGPGAINILSGVANAYFDSIPTVFITGQINTNEYCDNKSVRQHSFQDVDIVSIVASITKYAVQISDKDSIRFELEKAYHLATTGRPGSVLIDIPMDIQRADINPESLEAYYPEQADFASGQDAIRDLCSCLGESKRPVLLVGNGVSKPDFKLIHAFAERLKIPIVTSVLAKDRLASGDSLGFGFLGAAYGFREANLIAAAKADSIIALGIALSSRQIGVKTKEFAPNAKLFRVDIESHDRQRAIKDNAIYHRMYIADFAPLLADVKGFDFTSWFEACVEIRDYYHEFEATQPGREPNRLIELISELIPDDTDITCDIGQHMMWLASSFRCKSEQRLLFSGGHGAMGYALPAAIGAYYNKKKPVYCFVGDGGFQMNIQELEWVAREQIPIKAIVLNNHALGMIRYTQKELFNSEFEGTSVNHNYSACDFVKVAQAYGIRAERVGMDADLGLIEQYFTAPGPLVLEVDLTQDTVAYPKTHFGEPIYNQHPYIPADDLQRLLEL